MFSLWTWFSTMAFTKFTHRGLGICIWVESSKLSHLSFIYFHAFHVQLGTKCRRELQLVRLFFGRAFPPLVMLPPCFQLHHRPAMTWLADRQQHCADKQRKTTIPSLALSANRIVYLSSPWGGDKGSLSSNPIAIGGHWQVIALTKIFTHLHPPRIEVFADFCRDKAMIVICSLASTPVGSWFV
jgi:hypothetical protein